MIEPYICISYAYAKILIYNVNTTESVAEGISLTLKDGQIIPFLHHSPVFLVFLTCILVDNNNYCWSKHERNIHKQQLLFVNNQAKRITRNSQIYGEVLKQKMKHNHVVSSMCSE